MKVTVSLLFIACIFCTSKAQVIANDSVDTGAGFRKMVFYSLATGSKTTVADTDWHLMISVRPSQYPNSPLGGTTIRINEARGVQVFIAPNANALSFNTLDTSGWQSWPQLHDADTLIDLGALNSNRSNNVFDFGWGLYNENTHNVIGDSVYLIQLPDGELKKFLVNGLFYDTAYDMQYANVDNTDSQSVHISKIQYQAENKEFVYLNLFNANVLDKEPASNAWDLEFLYYAATDGPVQPVTREVGVWVNEGTQAAKAVGVDVSSDYYSGSAFSNGLNSIGWNWEVYNTISGTYTVQDSLAYFVRTNAGTVYKIIFTGLGGSDTGVISFNSSRVPVATGIDYIAHKENTLLIFPNPAQETASVITSNAGNNASIKIFDNTGRLIEAIPVMGNLTQINTGSFPAGLYFVALSSSEGYFLSKLAVAH